MANGSRYAPYAFCGVLVGRRDRLSKRKKLKATKRLKKRAAYPSSAAHCVSPLSVWYLLSNRKVSIAC